MPEKLSSEERERIAEEQRIRNKENFKVAGKVWLIIGGIAIIFFLCSCVFLSGVLTWFLSQLSAIRY